MLEPESTNKPVFLVPVAVPVPTANTMSLVLFLIPSLALNLPTNAEPILVVSLVNDEPVTAKLAPSIAVADKCVYALVPLVLAKSAFICAALEIPYEMFP